MKTWFFIFALILYSLAMMYIGSTLKDCPGSITITPASSIIIDQPLIDSLQNASQLWHKKAMKYQKQKDSIQTILNKKNETKIIPVDTCIPAILREWADYQSKE